MKCPVGLDYHQCHEGCPQTCGSLKNTSMDSSCNQLKIDGCFCPKGKVLQGESCVDSILCGIVFSFCSQFLFFDLYLYLSENIFYFNLISDTCDEDGHVVSIFFRISCTFSRIFEVVDWGIAI